VLCGLKHRALGITGPLESYGKPVAAINVCIQVLIILENSAFFDVVKFHYFLCGPSGAKSIGNDGSGLLLLLLDCCDEAKHCCVNISRQQGVFSSVKENLTDDI
jgi:hypothetical protein